MLTERQYFLLNFGMHQRVPWLERSDRCDCLCSLHLLDVKIRDSDPTHFALALQFRHGAPPLLKFLRVLHRPVNLVEVNGVHFESTEAILAFPSNGYRRQSTMSLALGVPTESA